MRKLVLMVGLTVVAVACGTAGDMVGEILDSGVPDADASIGMDGSTGGTRGAAGTNGSAGTNGTAGTNGSPGADVSVSCNKSGVDQHDGYSYTWRWAEFDVDPGVTEVTVCRAAIPGRPNSAWGRSMCIRSKATWFAGTSTGVVTCGWLLDYDDPDRDDSDSPDPVSITVHR